MDILIEQNTRGALEIKQKAFNKLLKMVTLNALTTPIKDVEIITEMHQENYLYVLVKLVVNPQIKTFNFEEKKIIHQIEVVITQLLNFKPKNIAIAYQRK